MFFVIRSSGNGCTFLIAIPSKIRYLAATFSGGTESGLGAHFFFGKCFMQVDLRKIESLVGPVAASLGYELVQAQLAGDQGGSILRILIDRAGGVQVADCEQLSREISTLLDVEGAVPGRYRLEVSSPGLNRPLVKEADFVRYVGSRAQVKTSVPIEGRRNYAGELRAVESGSVVMKIDGIEYRVPIGLIEKANLVF